MLPKARTENLLEQNLKDETLIYDLNIDKAFNLNETLSVVYKACDGIMTFEELKRKHKFTDDFIYLALDELKRNNLLAEDYQSPFERANRREVIKKVGLASMMMLPIITGLVAPKAASAASGGADNGVACTTQTQTVSAECKSGRCISSRTQAYDPATGGTSSGANQTRCCISSSFSSDISGSYSSGGDVPGDCNFAANCCTGTGTEEYDGVSNRYYCVCDATS